MIEIDCSEITADEQLALAGAITESLGGAGIAFAKGRSIAVDSLTGKAVDTNAVEATIRAFIARRKDPASYSLDIDGVRIKVGSANPAAAGRRERVDGLPPNVYSCPFCPFVTPYEELYVAHYRAHGGV